MTKILTIFKKEFKEFFITPLAYIIIGFFLVMSSFYFSTFINYYRVSKLKAY